MVQVKCILERKFLTVGKLYTVYDRTKWSIRVRNDIHSLEFIPKDYFKEVKKIDKNKR